MKPNSDTSCTKEKTSVSNYCPKAMLSWEDRILSATISMITRMLSKKPEWLKLVSGQRKKKSKELSGTSTRMLTKSKLPRTLREKPSRVLLKKFTLPRLKSTFHSKALLQHWPSLKFKLSSSPKKLVIFLLIQTMKPSSQTLDKSDQFSNLLSFKRKSMSISLDMVKL